MKIKYIYEIGVALLMILLLGLFYSRFLISLGVIALSALWIFNLEPHQLFRRWTSNLPAIAAGLILLVYLISVINTSNLSGYWAEIKNKIPYFFFPLGLLSMPLLHDREKRILAGWFLLILLVSSISTFQYYYTNRPDITDAYTRGQILPTVIHHVSYSILLVIGVLVSVHGALNSRNRFELAILLILLGWLVYMIHLLATRTALVGLYVLLPLYLVIFAVRQKAYLILILSLLGVLGVGAVFFTQTKTLRNKMEYVLYDLGQIKQHINTDNQLSDNRRLLSNRLGFEIALRHPCLGIGIGDVKDEMGKLYVARYASFEETTRAHIHNQFIYIFAGCGFILGAVFIFAILLPVYYYFRQQKLLSALGYLGLVMVMLWEPFLEYQYGNTIYLLVLALGIFENESI